MNVSSIYLHLSFLQFHSISKRLLHITVGLQVDGVNFRLWEVEGGELGHVSSISTTIDTSDPLQLILQLLLDLR